MVELVFLYKCNKCGRHDFFPGNAKPLYQCPYCERGYQIIQSSVIFEEAKAIIESEKEDRMPYLVERGKQKIYYEIYTSKSKYVGKVFRDNKSEITILTLKGKSKDIQEIFSSNILKTLVL